MNRRTSAFQRHPLLTGLVFMFIVLLVVGVLAEVGLRLAGHKPNVSKASQVGKVVIENRFTTDAIGILKLNPAFYDSIGVEVNDEGFRDREFSAQLAETAPRIMFVGDSFVYGASAVPKSEAFTDVIEKYGVTAFNFGVPGTGPTQYAAITEHYLPIVKPDFLAIMVFLGNDINSTPDRLVPNELTHYATNAGMIPAYDAKGRHMEPDEAVRYYFGGWQHRAEDWGRQSVVLGFVGKRILNLRNRLMTRPATPADATAKGGGTSADGKVAGANAKGGGQGPAGADDANAGARSAGRNQYVVDGLIKIRAAAKAQGVRYCLFIIAPKPSERLAINKWEDVSYLFDGCNTVYVEQPEENYRPGGDSHYNNAGHGRMAEVVYDIFEHPDSPLIHRGE